MRGVWDRAALRALAKILFIFPPLNRKQPGDLPINQANNRFCQVLSLFFAGSFQRQDIHTHIIFPLFFPQKVVYL